MEKRIKYNIRKGDKVMVITGEDKGKTGDVIEMLRDDAKLLVSGLNLVSKHTKPNAKNPNGGIIKKEAPIHISNVMLLDPKSGNPTRIKRERESGKTKRISKKSGEVIK